MARSIEARDQVIDLGFALDAMISSRTRKRISRTVIGS
jgi:hypothetical protein